jgi:hypothetical protein
VKPYAARRPGVTVATILATALLAASCRATVGGGTAAPRISATQSGTASVQIPGWCGGVPIGPAPGPSESPHPYYTPDPRTLLCMLVENKSTVDMAIADGDSWSLVAACTSMESSGPVPEAPWAYEVGRATPGSIDGPVLGTVSSSALTGQPPFLVKVVINPDLSLTVRQQTSLPSLTERFC